MFCSKCGQAMAEGAYFCPKCGADNSAAVVAPPAVPGAPPLQQQTSGMAIGSLVCSLLPFFIITPVVAVVLGHLSLSQIKKSAGRLKGSGLAIAGLIIGYCSVALFPIILIVAAIAMPNLVRAKMAANESSAMSSVRSLSFAEVSYVSIYPDKGYTCALADLKDQEVDAKLASGAKNGYVFELVGCKPETDGGPNTQFQLIAYPVDMNKTGTRSFCSDQTAVIRYKKAGSGQDCLDSGVPIGQ